MLIAVDVDNTIASDTNQYALWLTERLQLPVNRATLESITMYGEFERLPVVERFMNEHPAEYEQALAEADESAEIMSAIPPLPGAVDGLRQLSQVARIIYVTCRTPEHIGLTRQWLFNHRFPASNAVYSASQYHMKYVHAYMQAAQDEPVVIIDDSAFSIVKSFRYLAIEFRSIAISLANRVSVIAFASNKQITFPSSILHIGYMPSWAHEDMMELLALIPTAV